MSFCRGWRFLQILLPTLPLLAVVGCVSAAHQLDQSVVKDIKNGETTRQQVIKEFGIPRQILTEDGNTILSYWINYHGWRSQYGPSESPSITALTVLIGRDDRVIRTAYSSHNVDFLVRSRVNDQSIALIKKGETSKDQAISILGEPAIESLSTAGNPTVIWLMYEPDGLGGRTIQQFEVFLDPNGIVSFTWKRDFR